jgi:predicted ATP-grasp superfamily ATP-dependent carboligase
MKVLITDAENKHALAAVRSLGKKGIDVIASSHRTHCMSFYSKYCNNHYTYSKTTDESAFISDLLEIIESESCDVLLPIGFNSNKIISKNISCFSEIIKIPIVDYHPMELASDKNQTMKFAYNHGIPIPSTYYPTSIEELKEISTMVTFPVVLKASEESGSVKYANNKYELIELFSKLCESFPSQIKAQKYPLVQEYIPGEGYGFFALFDHGQPKAIFGHRRIHEYPVTGGPSTMAQSVFDSEMNDIGVRLLGELKWHGVAMVEFKKDHRDGSFKLIEINPKFWGSLDLSIACGIDFPYLACMLGMGYEFKEFSNYRQKLYFRWIFPDMMYAISTGNISEYFLNFTRKDVKDDFDIRDIKPHFFQVIKFLNDLYANLWHLRYPHGKPELK